MSSYQWQYVDAVSGNWVDYAGATSADFVVPNFLLTQGLGVRVKVSYVDGKGYTEQLLSASTVAAITLPGTAQHAADHRRGNAVQRHREHDRACRPGVRLLLAVRARVARRRPDLQRPADRANTLIYKRRPARMARRCPTPICRSTSIRRPAPASSRASLVGPDGTLRHRRRRATTLDTPGQIGVRVTATDPGGLSVTDTFVIDVVPPNSPPLAADDNYTTFENVGLTTLPSTGVLHNDIDPNADPFTAAVVAGPTNGTLTFHADGTFVYIPNNNFVGTDTFTYQDKDSAGAVSNVATATINVVNAGKITVVPTRPGNGDSVTESFTAGALPPVPGTLTFSWDTSPDGGTWTPTGVASATFAPALTGPTGSSCAERQPTRTAAARSRSPRIRSTSSPTTISATR